MRGYDGPDMRDLSLQVAGRRGEHWPPGLSRWPGGTGLPAFVPDQPGFLAI
jgi:hypothetical protein